MIFKIKTKYFNEKGTQIGNSVILRKEIPVENITSIEEVYKELSTGTMKLIKTKCMLICNPPIGNIIVEKDFNSMKQILDDEFNRDYVFVKGFKRYD